MHLLKKALPAIVFIAVAAFAVTLYICIRQPNIVAEPLPSSTDSATASTAPSTSTPEPSAPTFSTTAPTAKREGDFVLTKVQDFDREAPVGKFEAVYGNKLTGYNGFFDHANRGPGLYAPARVLSVKDGVLNYDLHTENGVPLVAAPTPTGYSGQLYGRYSVRFRADLAPGYRVAFLLWPDGTENADLWKKGEIDFPETDLQPLSEDAEKVGSINGFSHDVTGNPVFNHLRYITRETAREWHTATIEWTPDRVSFSLDDKVQASSNPAAIPTHPMHWILQTQVSSAKGVSPAADVRGDVQVDWFAQYRWDPKK